MQKNEIVDRLGHNIRAERMKRNISQEKLAEMTGMHKNYIGIIERGEKNVTVLRCFQIAQALNIPLTDLVPLTDQTIEKE